MRSANRQRLLYVVADYLSTNLGYMLFNFCRYRFLPNVAMAYSDFWSFETSRMVIWGQLLFPVLMMGVYYLSGYYNSPFHKSRLQDFITTGGSALIGTLVVFLTALTNDMGGSRLFNYEIILSLLACMFIPVYTVRWFITRHATRCIHSRQWGFPTLIVGTSPAAVALHQRLDSMKRSMGYDIVGHVAVGPMPKGHFPYHAVPIDNIEDECLRRGIRYLIVVPGGHSDERESLQIVNRLLPLDIPIYMSPDMLHVVTSRVQTVNVAGEPLVEVSRAGVTGSTRNIKRLCDIIVSAVMLLLLSPVIGILAIAIKCDSPGPIFYRQQRVGYHRRMFNIIKLRSMKVDSECHGPRLSSADDPRVTRLGHMLRKYRLDELPQFWNVLVGDMSLVGPRPEREHFINLIMRQAPYYTLVHSVRPGITSWGMVKYGYASSVDQMVERLRYDLIYIENVSFPVDMKIILYTIRTVFTGKGV